jgi:hypothetical protein
MMEVLDIQERERSLHEGGCDGLMIKKNILYSMFDPA